MAKTSTDEQALLRGIVATPDDDLPRLVYADWLEEHGRTPRATFIRMQIEEHRLGEQVGHWTVWERKSTCRQLTLEHSNAWQREWPRWVRQSLTKTILVSEFSRGFMWRQRLSASPFLTYGADWLNVHPVQMLALEDSGNLLQRLSKCEALERVTSLRLNVHMKSPHAKDVRQLLNSPHLSRLTRLDLTDWPVTWDLVRELARGYGLAKLQELCLSSRDMTRPMIEHLFNSAVLPPSTQFFLNSDRFILPQNLAWLGGRVSRWNGVWEGL